MTDQDALSLIKTVEIYTIPACFFCTSAKELLTDLGIKYDEKPCDSRNTDPNFAVGTANREALYARAPDAPRQFPQIFINGQRIGGFDGLKAALSRIGLYPVPAGLSSQRSE